MCNLSRDGICPGCAGERWWLTGVPKLTWKEVHCQLLSYETRLLLLPCPFSLESHRLTLTDFVCFFCYRDCQVCKGTGLVHNSLMTHRAPCPYCEPCPNCRGTASREYPSASTPLVQKVSVWCGFFSFFFYDVWGCEASVVCLFAGSFTVFLSLSRFSLSSPVSSCLTRFLSFLAFVYF